MLTPLDIISAHSPTYIPDASYQCPSPAARLVASSARGPAALAAPARPPRALSARLVAAAARPPDARGRCARAHTPPLTLYTTKIFI